MANSLSAQLEYRGNFFAGLLESLGQIGIGFLSLSLFFRNSSALGGWSLPEAALVLGFYMLTISFISVFLYPNLSRIAEQVRLGTMDFTALKPLDAQFHVSTRNLNAFRMGDGLIGLVVVIWALVQLGGVGVVALLAGVVLYLCALAIVYSIFLILATTAFWWVKVENITELFTGLLGAARFPASSFPGWVRAFLTFVVPITFITTVPAQAMLGRSTLTLTLVSPLIALALLAISRLFWLYALRSYTSASS
ncbi:ABC transporter permease [Deinococcus peraridilitoris]|nr:ABC-2 family transporter protein [Deinococcus peraridilitoris]